MKLTQALDKLEDCLKNVWVPDRIGGYTDTVLNRKKAAKLLREVAQGGMEALEGWSKPCKNYNKYKGTRKPTCGCQPCYEKYLLINGGR